MSQLCKIRCHTLFTSNTSTIISWVPERKLKKPPLWTVLHIGVSKGSQAEVRKHRGDEQNQEALRSFMYTWRILFCAQIWRSYRTKLIQVQGKLWENKERKEKISLFSSSLHFSYPEVQLSLRAEHTQHLVRSRNHSNSPIREPSWSPGHLLHLLWPGTVLNKSAVSLHRDWRCW